MLIWFSKIMKKVKLGTKFESDALLVLPASLMSQSLFDKWNAEWTHRLRSMPRHTMAGVIHDYTSVQQCGRHNDEIQVNSDSKLSMSCVVDTTPLMSSTADDKHYGALNDDSPTKDEAQQCVNHLPPNCPSVFWTLLCLLKWDLAYGLTFRIVADITNFIGPILLIELLQFVEAQTQPRWRGCAIALAMFSSAQIGSLAHNAFCLTVCRSRVAIQGMLSMAIYDKALRLFTKVHFVKNRQELLNALAVDVEKVERTLLLLSQLLSFIIQVIIGIFLLSQIVGNAAVITAAFLVLLFYCNMKLTDYKPRRHITDETENMNWIKQICKLLQETKTNEKVNMNAILKKLEEYRTAKIKRLKVANTYQSFLLVFNATANFVATYLTFFLYAWNHATEFPIFTPITMFVSSFLILLLQRPFQAASKFHRKFNELKYSNKRLESLLMAEEIDKTEVERDLDAKYDRSIDISGASFDSQLTDSRDGHSSGLLHASFELNDVEVHVKRGVHVAVIAGSDAGNGMRSSVSSLRFLDAILGEMHKAYGYVSVRGKMAYCLRRSWLLNDTIRTNVILRYSDDENSVDEERYTMAINICELNSSDSLPLGDRTFVGDVANIQMTADLRTKITLARALYRNADIYLFDDVWSTMEDQNLAKRLYTRIVKCPLRSGCTRIVVEYVPSHVEDADLIVLIDEQMVKFSGSLKDLALNEEAMQLINRLCNEDAEEDDNPENQNIKTGNDDFNAFLLRTELAETQDAESKSTPSIYSDYVHASGICVLIISVVFLVNRVIFEILNLYWLSNWANPPLPDDPPTSERFVVYFIMGTVVALTLSVGLFVTRRSAQKITKSFLNELVDKTEVQSCDIVEPEKIDRFFYRAFKDVERVDWSMSAKFQNVMLNSSNILFIFALFFVRWPLFIVLIIAVIVATLPIMYSFICIATKLRRMKTIALDTLLLRVDNTLTGLKTIRVYAVSNEFFHRFQCLAESYGTVKYTKMLALCWVTVRMELIGNLFVLAIGVIAAFATFLELPASLVGLFVVASYQLSGALKDYARNATGFQSESDSFRRLQNIQSLVVKEETVEKINFYDWPRRGSFLITQLTCASVVGGPVILTKFDLTVPAVGKIGIRKCGANSNALWAALTRRVPLASGQIAVDDINIAECTGEGWRQRITIVSSSLPVFTGTLRSYLDPAGIYTDAELWRAIESVKLNALVTSQYAGPDELLTCDDLLIKPRHRVSIILARAILQKRRVLIMDDAQFCTKSSFHREARQLLYDEFCDATIFHFSSRQENFDKCDKKVFCSSDLSAESQPSMTSAETAGPKGLGR